MKTMYPPGYQHNSFVATHAHGHEFINRTSCAQLHEMPQCIYISILCIYIYMYVYLIHIYTYMFVYIHICICIYVCMYVCVYMYMYIYTYIYMYVCVCIYIYLCMCIYIYVGMYIYIYIYIYINIFQLLRCVFLISTIDQKVLGNFASMEKNLYQTNLILKTKFFKS